MLDMLHLILHIAGKSVEFENKKAQIEAKKQELISEGKEHLQRVVEFGNKTDEALALISLGVIYGYTGKYEIAITYFRQADALAKQIDFKNAHYLALANLGTIMKISLDFDAAESYYLQAYEVARELREENRIKEISMLFDDLEYMKNLDQYKG
jgi:tetratricopeptide (TPR) repeat protein